MNQLSKNIISVFFLIMFCNSIFAYGMDFGRLDFAGTSSETQGVIFDRGNGCSTVALPETAVNALWREILTKGFSAEGILSGEPATTTRATLDQNNVLLTTQDAKAGDLAIKQEIPSQQLKPLETPTLLGQSCFGPYGFGINLKDTLRLGRCTGGEADSQCYLSDFGQYRKNDMTGFFKEAGTVAKDAFVGVKETIIGTGDVNKDKLANEDLSIFSDISTAEINSYLSAMESSDMNVLDTETWNAKIDNAIKNTSRTTNFSVTMQTTCRGEDCYINTYTLFDKMFNQYFSLDMVYSATTPFLYNGMARIVNTPAIKKTVTKPFEVLKKKGVIKDGGFLDTLTKDPALFIQDPFGRVRKSIDAGRYAGKDVDKFITHKIEPLNNTVKRNVQSYEIQDYTTDLLTSTQKGLGDTSAFTSNAIVKNSYELSNARKRAATDIAQIYGDRVYSANALLKSKMTSKEFLEAKNIVDSTVAKNLPITEAYKQMTKAQLDAYTDTAYTASRLADAYDIASFKTFKWKTGYEDSGLVSLREYDNVGRINNYMSADGKTTVKLLETGDKKPALFDDFDAFRYKKDGDYYVLKDMDKLQTQKINVPLADGTTVNLKRIRAVRETPDPTNAIKNIDDLTNLENLINKNPSGFVEFYDIKNNTYKQIRSYEWDSEMYAGVATNVNFYPKAKISYADDIVLDPNTGLTISDVYGKGYFDMDPLETMKQVMDTVPKKFDETSKGFNEVIKTLGNKEWVGGRGRDALNQFIKTYNGTAYQRLITSNPAVFGINFAYWEIKTGGATFFGDDFGLTKFSMYQLPQSYSALLIKHQETPKIYEDAYVDFFANEGSDQGDLFMQFLNFGVLNWSNFLAKEITAAVGANWANSINNVLKKITEGQIRRSKTDDIVLVTDSLNNGCQNNCNYIVGAEYIEANTRNASLQIETDTAGTEAVAGQTETGSSQPVADNSNDTQEEQSKKDTTQTKSTSDNKVSLDSISIYSYTPDGINTLNYVLENTSEENQKKQGQTLITFSHHTDYDGTFSNQSTENAINLLDARGKEETCAQAVENLTFAGMPIGKIVPKSMRNYRYSIGLIAEQKLAYLVFPAAGYTSSFLAPALTSDIPQMFLIMPQLHNCVDDEEGTYAHFFVSNTETERLAKDSKNKVGETIKGGVTKAEDAMSKVTSGTELEKGVKYGAEQIKEFTGQKLVEYPIVQATYKTSGRTNTFVNGQLFFFEVGPGTKCNAVGYIDKGVETLKDKDTNISLTIDKEKGEMNAVDSEGNLKEIIGPENKDFVRLIGTNLGIPAKVVPRSLSYIPVPNNTEPLFEIDSFGNFSVKNADFLDCLRAGYEAQTGLTIPSNVSNLTEYLGAVKVGNTVHPTTNYLIKPQGTEIVAEGIPNYIATGTNAKAVILGNRRTTISPVDSRQITLGQNVGIQFENAQLIYSEEKRAYIMWVETTTVTNGNDIDKLKTEIIKEKATNGCDTEELGLNFSVTPKEDNDYAKANTDKLNKALEKVGPFQIFDTATKTFIFYVSDPPECEQRLKIIDKETGEVTDQKIISTQQTPTGMIVKTDDGKTHDLGFSAEEGVPTLTYNGDKETLTSAQGKNGSFWYDPETGNWYTTNGNLIPFNDKFKDGITFAVDPNGLAVGTPGNQVFNIGTGGSGSSGNGINVPLTPESLPLLVFYVFVIVLGFLLIYSKKR